MANVAKKTEDDLQYWEGDDRDLNRAEPVVEVEVTDAQIETLEHEAFAAGDALQGYICRVALGADYELAELADDSCLDADERRIVANLSQDTARAKCESVVRDGRSQS